MGIPKQTTRDPKRTQSAMSPEAKSPRNKDRKIGRGGSASASDDILDHTKDT